MATKQWPWELRILASLGIDRIQDVRNPLDATPVADDVVFAERLEAILEDENVDCAVVSPVPLTPAMQTLAPGPEHRKDDALKFLNKFVGHFQKGHS